VSSGPTNGTRPDDDRHRQRPPVDLERAGILPIDWSTLWTVDPVGEDWCVEPILPRGRQAGLFSPAGAGKSLLAVDVAAAKATGRSVLGHPAQDPVPVVYIDQEMNSEDLRERLGDLGYGPGDDLSKLHYYQLSALPPLDSPEGGDALLAIVALSCAQLVVLDTVARIVAGDENSADTYRDFFRCTGCRLKGTGTALLRLDHAGKDPSKGQRGSSSKNDDLDIVWRLHATEDRVVLTRVKSRVSYVPSEVSLTRETEPALRHVLAPVAVPAGTAEVIELLDELGIAPDATAAIAMRQLKVAGHGKRKTVVLAALKVRASRRFPNSGNRSLGEDGNQLREPRGEDVASAQVNEQISVPGTMREPVGTDPESMGTGGSLWNREPVPDRLNWAVSVADDDGLPEVTDRDESEFWDNESGDTYLASLEGDEPAADVEDFSEWIDDPSHRGFWSTESADEFLESLQGDEEEVPC
jgi:hypothetical protein